MLYIYIYIYPAFDYAAILTLLLIMQRKLFLLLVAYVLQEHTPPFRVSVSSRVVFYIFSMKVLSVPSFLLILVFCKSSKFAIVSLNIFFLAFSVSFDFLQDLLISVVIET